MAQTAGAIGYVEYAYAKVNHLKYHAHGQQGRQDASSPTIDTFKAAAGECGLGWRVRSNGFYIILVDQPGEKSWPITATTYILVYKQPVDAAATAGVLKFFKWAYAQNGDQAGTGASTMCRCRIMPFRPSRPAGTRSRARECKQDPLA